MATEIAKIDEEFGVEFYAAVISDIELDHPSLDPFGIELLVPGGVQGIGEKHAASVAADFDHLWPAVQRLARLCWMRSATNNSANVHRTDQLGIERVGDVILPHLARSPT